MPESSVSSPTGAIPADVVASCRSLPLPRLVEALREDQAQRWRSGHGLPAETYIGAFPALAASPEDALVLVWGEALCASRRARRRALRSSAAAFRSTPTRSHYSSI